MKKIFAVSDIHGHFTELLFHLKEVGWNKDDDNHLLIVVGDLFDRGSESLELYLFLKNLTDNKKAIVLKGNHDAFILEFLGHENPTNFNMKFNGLNTTVSSFLGREVHYNDWYEFHAKASKEINDKYPELINWLLSLPNYFETKNFIFTHGCIDTDVEDWHYPAKDWDWCHWDNGGFFAQEITNTDKTVVVGHFDTRSIRRKYHIGDKEDYSILYRADGRVIMLDGCVVVTKKVNVLVVDDELSK